MRWQGGRESDNVEDRRGMRGGPRMAVGGGLGLIIVVVVALLFGADPGTILRIIAGAGGQVQVEQPEPGGAAELSPEQKKLGQFVSVVLADTEDTWDEIFAAQGLQYRRPKLVLFTGQVESACGYTSAAVGPFYCPADEKIYIDLSFYEDLRRKLGAPGDFAQAYVIAHEVGHHVQKLLGTSDRVHNLQQNMSRAEANQLSVRLELQADYYAGVWAHYANKRNIIEPGDIDEALNAASAIGDDRLQEQSRGYVTPDSFTHGTSAQRVRWFRKGFETGDLRQGDTFATDQL